MARGTIRCCARPLAGAVPAIAIVAAGFSVALALWALGRTAQALQRSLDQRDEALVREQAVRASAQVAAEVERSLHDTALNTLETIAAHGDHLDREVVAARCRADYDQLASWRSEATIADLPEVLRGLEERGPPARPGRGGRARRRRGREAGGPGLPVAWRSPSRCSAPWPVPGPRR